MRNGIAFSHALAIALWFVAITSLTVHGQEAAIPGRITITEPIFEVPRVADITIDGNLEDWGDTGLRVQTLTSAKGMPWTKPSPPPTMRLGWNESGLLVGLAVHHRDGHEYDYVRHLFKGESVEVFVSTKKGSRDRYMLVVSPGSDPRYPDPRHCFFPDPSEEGERDISQWSFQMARAKSDDGYTMELLLPWKNLNMEAKVGMELALQVYVMESDGNEECLTAMWHPAGESHVDPYASHRLRLGTRGSRVQQVVATAQDDVQRNTRIVRIVGSSDVAGRQFEVKTDGGVIYGSLAARGTQAFGTFDLARDQAFEVVMARQHVPLVQLPPDDNLQAIMLGKLKCSFKQCIFSGDQFPRPSLEGVRNYRITKTNFYDADFNLVTSAQQPGLYGAVVEISDARGKITTRRLRSLLRVPKQVGNWHEDTDRLEDLPHRLAEDPRVAVLAGQALALYPSMALHSLDTHFLTLDTALRDADTVALLAYLCAGEGAAGRKVGAGDFRVTERQWWVDLKRKLYGSEKRYPQPFVCPRPVSGRPTRILREGTCQDAGMKVDAADKIDAVCQKAVETCGEPIAVCLARHGVVFFHRAYGQVEGVPMTVDTKCPTFSMAKPLAGTLMMLVVDQGLVRLDDPMEKLLPPFKGIRVKTPMTVRHLYTHMNGLTGMWGDEMHDTEEIIGSFYSVIDVGTYSYNNLAMALGSKILEQVSGEALPRFAKQHLLEPLGMRNTDLIGSGNGVRSVAMDYARLGQMLLNRGDYGNMKFFSSETFEQMLPAPGWGSRGGVGVEWENRLGKGTFGHSSANSGMFRVDPEHDLVVVVTSAAAARKGFVDYYPQFLSAITNGLDESKDRASSEALPIR